MLFHCHLWTEAIRYQVFPYYPFLMASPDDGFGTKCDTFSDCLWLDGTSSTIDKTCVEESK
jgi:hypothetical protein